MIQGKQHQPKIIPSAIHGLHLDLFNKNAINITKKLQLHGFEAYIVGGGIRDLLLKKKPKDFDIATNARPQQIHDLFSRSRLIGRRFRLVHIYFRQETIEIATFRSDHKDAESHEARSHYSGLILCDNVYGTLEDDAKRRDFTINALYYNPSTEELLDFFSGYQDLLQKKIRIIGEAELRYREDPVRILRATRFAGKLGFTLETKTEEPIEKLSHLLHQISSARLYDEMNKIFHSGHVNDTIHYLDKLQILENLLPEIHYQMKQNPLSKKLYSILFKNTDHRIQSEKHTSPAFLFSVLLWPIFQERYNLLLREGNTRSLSCLQASRLTLLGLNKHFTIPKRVKQSIQDSWFIELRLESRPPRYIVKILQHPRFRAAYDLLILRCEIEPKLKKLSDWWGNIQLQNKEEQKQAISKLFK